MYMGMVVSRETIELFEKYQTLVFKWNKIINLISHTTIKEFWLRHVVDSLQLLSYIDNKDIKLIDVGSGAGLPGMVLSIAGVKEVVLVESDVRKSAFLLQASRISSNKVTILNKRVEIVRSACDILTSRAYANLSTIFSCTKDIKVRNKYLLLKGENYKQELNAARIYWSFDCSVHDSITCKKSKVLEISNLKQIMNENKNNCYS